MNEPLRRLLCSAVSQRRAAQILGLSRTTVVRKFLFLGLHSERLLNVENYLSHKAQTLEFDDLETFEHTKCKPLSVTLAVESKTRRILDFQVSRMPAKGRLARLSVKKYGPRKDERTQGRKELFKRLSWFIEKGARIKSDQNPHYVEDVKRYFPDSHHEAFKGQRGSSTGQGELKKIRFDPLFSLNHTCAMLRADINRLVRRTWSTTKKPERLSLHLALYALYHNENLVK